MRSSRLRYLNTLFVLLLLCLLLIPIRTRFNWYDEGFAVLNATRVMRGEIPHKDFWAIYPPGQSYALAAVSGLFGPNLIAARLYDTLVRLVIAIALYGIVRQLAPRPLALVASAASAILLAAATFYAYAVFPALALGLGAIWSVLRYEATGRRFWLVGAGLGTGAALLFRVDIGLYNLAAVLGMLLPSCIVRGGEKWHQAACAAAGMALLVGAGTVVVALPAYVVWGLRSGFGNLWAQVVFFPATALRAMRWRPYPPLVPPIMPWSSGPGSWDSFAEWLQFYLPLATYAAAGVLLVLSMCHTPRDRPAQNRGLLGLTIFGLLLFGQALNRYDFIHVLPSSVVTLAVMGVLVARTASGARGVGSALVGLPVAALLGVYLLAPTEALLSYLDQRTPWRCHSELERASCAFLEDDQELAVHYIQARTDQGEPIYVGNQRHDLIFVSDPGFYYLANRPSATMYHELHPGVATTLPVQETIAAEIAGHDVRWIVLFAAPPPTEPNASSRSSNVHYLDQWIRARYERLTGYGRYEIWLRKS